MRGYFSGIGSINKIINQFFNMAEIAKEVIMPDIEQKQGSGIEDIIVLLEKAMGGFDGNLPEHGGDDEDNDEEEPDDEEEEYNGLSLKEKVRRYQRDFSKYVEIIRKDLIDMGYDIRDGGNPVKDAEYALKKEDAARKADDDDRSPSERGHKWGCGCPGCTSYRENFMSKEMMDFSIPDGRTSFLHAKDTGTYKSEHKDDSSEYPCGGKLRGMFRRGFMKYALADVDKNPRLMNYLAV